MKLLVISSWTLISTVFPPLRKDSSAAPELVINNWGVDFDYTIFSNIVIIIRGSGENNFNLIYRYYRLKKIARWISRYFYRY
jgi:hypothetical protein